MSEILEKLDYCNKAIKKCKLNVSKTFFYKLKTQVLINFLNNTENITAYIKKLEIDKYGTLYILIRIYSEYNWYEFHQIDIKKYFKYLNINKLPNLSLYEHKKDLEEYDIKLANSYIDDLLNYINVNRPSINYLNNIRSEFPEYKFNRYGHKKVKITFKNHIFRVKYNELKKHYKENTIEQYLKELC